MMDFLALAKKRYSVRKYTSDKVEDSKVATILEAGRVAPTGANKQPHHLIVLRKEEGLNKISKAANVYDAPLVIMVCSHKEGSWVRPFDGKSLMDIDASIVTDHMMLQATALGLGSVWIDYFKPDVIKEVFDLPDYLEPINLLAIGYASEEPLSPDRHQETRKPLDEIVSYEGYLTVE